MNMKSGVAAAVVLAMVLQPVAPVYGEDFSWQEEAIVQLDEPEQLTESMVVDELEQLAESMSEDGAEAQLRSILPDEQETFEGEASTESETTLLEDNSIEVFLDDFEAVEATGEDAGTADTEAPDTQEGAEETKQLFEYAIQDDTVILTKYIGTDNLVEIPEMIEDYPVTVLGESVFADSTVTKVVVPENVTTIEKEAFSNALALEEVELPHSVSQIADDAFSGCENLTLVVYPDTYAQTYAEEHKIPCAIHPAEGIINLENFEVQMEESVTCTGEALTPVVTVLDPDGEALQADVDYSVEYQNNISPGTGSVKISGIGKYEGTIEKSFQIILAVPRLSSAVTASYNSIKVSWKAVPGAKSYNVYCKGGKYKKYKIVQEGVPATSYQHVSSTAYPLEVGTKYTYTVRAVCDQQISGYNAAGKTVKLKLGTVKLGKVQSQAYNQLKISWKGVSGANGYYIYIKSGNSWKKIGTSTSTTFTHTASTKFPLNTGVTYTYTVRAYRTVNKKNICGGYDKNGISGKAAPGTPTIETVECTTQGKILLRWKSVPGATHYIVYRKNAKGKWDRIATLAGANKVGYVHVFSKKFPIVKDKTYTYTVRSYCSTGKTYGGYNKTGKKVKATPAGEAEIKKAEANAEKIVNQITNSSMTKAQKLKVCFDWVIKHPYENRRVFARIPGWTGYYANDHFVYGKGDCHSDACAFAYLAKALGYSNIYVCTDTAGTANAHSWAEVDGLVYDPLFAEAKSYSRNYGVTYRTYILSAITREKI